MPTIQSGDGKKVHKGQNDGQEGGDVPETLPIPLWAKYAAKRDEPTTAGPLSDGVISGLDPYQAKPFEVLVELLEADPKWVRKKLLEAELAGWVRCWPGDRFTRTVR